MSSPAVAAVWASAGDAGGAAVDVLQAGGPWLAIVGLVLTGLRAILSGALVPRSTLDVLTTQWEARLKEGLTREADWREAYQNEAQRSDIVAGQMTTLMTYAETADRVLQSLPRRDGQ